MIEVRLFATLREGRGKIIYLESEKIATVNDVFEYFHISEEEVSILLINGYHSKCSDSIKEGDVISLFPPVAGG